VSKLIADEGLPRSSSNLARDREDADGSVSLLWSHDANRDVAKHLTETDDLSDPYRTALCLRAALCAAALEIRSVDPAAAERFLKAERSIAQSIIHS
jgi:hypothetical protein